MDRGDNVLSDGLGFIDIGQRSTEIERPRVRMYGSEVNGAWRHIVGR